MNTTKLQGIIKFRVAVGYLGEKEQYAWWPSSFFSSGSQAFLTPIFSKTRFLAQCHGVTRAALAVHDERIGTGHVYHLFRLPEDMEQDIHEFLHDPMLSREVNALITDKQTALAFLQQQSAAIVDSGTGPFRMGTTSALRNTVSWSSVIGHYARAFAQGNVTFPYFVDLS